jgi:hypothetical protein
MARFSLAKWKEDDPILGQDVLTNFGTDLDARDFSGGLTLTSMWLNSGNEFRFAHRTTNREWAGPSLPTTYFVGEAAESVPRQLRRPTSRPTRSTSPRPSTCGWRVITS